MSADEFKPTQQLSSRHIQRRSFLKMVFAGLAAAFPVAAGLMKPSRVMAAPPCTIKLCIDTEQDGDICVEGILIAYDIWACWDALTHDYCGTEWRNLRAVGCC